jgi:hypothetical protein
MGNSSQHWSCGQHIVYFPSNLAGRSNRVAFLEYSGSFMGCFSTPRNSWGYSKIGY